MFHPGRVVAVFRVDDKTVLGVDKSVQAMVAMWDDNLLTVEVEAQIADKIKESDVVLLDYSPKYTTIPVPKQTIVKILRGEAAKKIWSEYSERLTKRKAEAQEAESDRGPEGQFHIR